MLNGENKKAASHTLSQREKEIVLLIKRGLSSKEISDALGISTKTVEVHRYNILQKLQVRNSAALVHYINTSMPDLFV